MRSIALLIAIALFTPNKKAVTATVTAYSLTRDQTEGNPCIGAFGHNLCKLQKKGKKICATRRFKEGTKLHIPGYGECEVLDKTSKRYAHRIDVLFASRSEALRWGRRELLVQVASA